MSEEEIVNIIAERVTISIYQGSDIDGEYTEVSLLLDGDVISSDRT